MQILIIVFVAIFVLFDTTFLFIEIISLETEAKLEAILFLFGHWELNGTFPFLLTSELISQCVKSTIHMCGIHI